MISNPIYDNFYVALSRNFLSTVPEIEKSFGKYYARFDFQYASLVDYMNSTIMSASLHGLKINVNAQLNNGEVSTRLEQGTKKTFSTGLSARANTDKKITIEFKILNNYFGYFLMRKLFVYFNNRHNNNKNWFLPEINMGLIDDYGNIIFTNTYDDIIFESISEMTWKKNDTTVQYKSFNCTFVYNRNSEIDVFDSEFEGHDGLNTNFRNTDSEKTSYKS